MLSFSFTSAGQIIYTTCLQLCRLTSKGTVVFQELPLGKGNKWKNKLGLEILSCWNTWLIQKLNSDFNKYFMSLRKTKKIVKSTFLWRSKILVFYIPLSCWTCRNLKIKRVLHSWKTNTILQGFSLTLEIGSWFFKQRCEEIKHDPMQERTMLKRQTKSFLLYQFCFEWFKGETLESRTWLLWNYDHSSKRERCCVFIIII